MEELIFFAVIILFSIVESVARSRKAKRGGGESTDSLPDLSLPEPWDVEDLEGLRDAEREAARRGAERFDAEERDPEGRDKGWKSSRPETRLPSYDQDPSYDDLAAKRTEGAQQRRASSETMLPGDLLEELAALAGRAQQEKERQKGRPVPLPKQSPPLPRTSTTGPKKGAVTRRPQASPARVEHEVHLSHAGWGTDPSERARSEQDGLDPLAEYLSEDSKAVRSQLLGGSRASLRQAIIVREVLGPPLALRDDSSRG